MRLLSRTVIKYKYYTVFLALRVLATFLAGAGATIDTSQDAVPQLAGLQAQQQAHTPHRPQVPHPERFNNTAAAINIPRVPPSLPIWINVNMVATIKNIPPRIRPQLLEPV